ncbi:MAG: VWA domain-containing protein [Planctomycetota bacterium]|nr:VWA domain-containing protein [Planctomycetota bacterium]
MLNAEFDWQRVQLISPGSDAANPTYDQYLVRVTAPEAPADPSTCVYPEGDRTWQHRALSISVLDANCDVVTDTAIVRKVLAYAHNAALYREWGQTTGDPFPVLPPGAIQQVTYTSPDLFAGLFTYGGGTDTSFSATYPGYLDFPMEYLVGSGGGTARLVDWNADNNSVFNPLSLIGYVHPIGLADQTQRTKIYQSILEHMVLQDGISQLQDNLAASFCDVLKIGASALSAGSTLNKINSAITFINRGTGPLSYLVKQALSTITLSRSELLELSQALGMPNNYTGVAPGLASKIGNSLGAALTVVKDAFTLGGDAFGALIYAMELQQYGAQILASLGTTVAGASGNVDPALSSAWQTVNSELSESVRENFWVLTFQKFAEETAGKGLGYTLDAVQVGLSVAAVCATGTIAGAPAGLVLGGINLGISAIRLVGDLFIRQFQNEENQQAVVLTATLESGWTQNAVRYAIGGMGLVPTETQIDSVNWTVSTELYQAAYAADEMYKQDSDWTNWLRNQLSSGWADLTAQERDFRNLVVAAITGKNDTWHVAGRPESPDGPIYFVPEADLNRLIALVGGQSAGVSVVEVLDCSGTMADEGKLDAAKVASGLFADLLGTGDKIGIVSYSTDATTNFPLTVITPATAPQTLLADSMDSLGNWTADSPWGLTSSDSHSGGRCATDSPSGDYTDYADTSLTLNSGIDLPSGESAVLQFWHKYDLENSCDYGSVEASVDVGAWTQIMSFTGQQTDWTQESVPLDAYAGHNLRIRFRLTSDYSVTRDGWYVDDVTVATEGSGTVIAAKRAIDHIEATDMTSIGSGVAAADDQLDRFPGDPIRAMIVMTDGLQNTDPAPISVINDQVDSNIRIFTIGFGSDADGALLAEMANLRNGQYYYAASGSDLQWIYAELVGLAAGQQQVANYLGTINTGQTQSQWVQVDPSSPQVTFGLNWPGSDMDLELVAPDGTVIDHAYAATHSDVEFLQGATYEFYKVHSPLPGTWQVQTTGVNVAAGGESYSVYAMASTSIRASARTNLAAYQTGDTVALQVTVDDGAPILNAAASVTITTPHGAQPASATLVLYDDGQHGDGAANDGVYGNTFRRTRWAGTYAVQFNVQGTSNSGITFVRKPSLSFQVTQGAPIPAAPIFVNARASLVALDGQPFTWDFDTDEERSGGEVTYSLADAPTWLTMDSTTGVISGTPGTIDVGTVTVTVRAQDAYDGETDRVCALQTLPLLGQFGRIGGRYATASFADSDGTQATFSLKGAGLGKVYGDGTIWGVALTGTDLKTGVTFVGKKSRTPGDNGEITLAAITVQGSVKSLTASSGDLTGELAVTGTVAGLTLPDVSGGSISIGTRAAGDAQTATALALRSVHDATITSRTPISSLTVIEWTATPGTDNRVTAPSLGTLTTRGQKASPKVGLSALAGDFAASMRLDGTVIVPRKQVLNSVNIAGTLTNAMFDVTGGIGDLTVKGSVSGSNIRSIGSINSITMGASYTSVFLAGIAPSCTQHASNFADFANIAGRIKSIKIKGLPVPRNQTPPRFMTDTYFSAAFIDSASLLNATFSGCGLYARESGPGLEVKSVGYRDTADGDHWQWPPHGNDPFSGPARLINILS